MAIDFRPDRYLIDQSRRRVKGVLVTIGSGGTIPGRFQKMVDAIATAQTGGKREFAAKAKQDLRSAMKSMQGRILVLTHGTSLMFVDSASSMRNALRAAKWSVPEDKLAEAFPRLFKRR